MVAVLFLVLLAVVVLQIVAWPRLAEHRGARIASVAGALVLSGAHQLMFSTLAEDAFISFRYSLNLAEGNGMVFNVGERVEGYSNFLWVVLVAAPRAVAGVDIVYTARVLGVLCTLGCVVLAYLLAKRVTGTPKAGVLAATITAAAGSLAAYGPSGLETPLFTLLVLGAALALHAERTVIAGLLVALATMTRPDGALIALVIAVWLLFTARRGLLWYLVGAAVLLAPWTAWRLTYYGHLLPNALAAKSGAALSWQFELGWDYLLGFLTAAQALLVLVPVAIYALLSARKTIEPRTGATAWLLFVLAFVQLAFFVSAGGDWMPAWRFFAPTMPLLAAGVAIALSATAGERIMRAAPVLAGSVSALLIMVSAWNATMKPSIDEWHRAVDELGTLGSWVHRTVPAGTVISTYANGALSYQAGTDITVIDQLGLTDDHIARDGKRLTRGVIGHLAHDYDYVVNTRRPDLVFVTGGGFYRERTCDVLPAFQQDYRGVVFKHARSGLWALVYVRTARAEELTARLATDPDFSRAPCPSA